MLALELLDQAMLSCGLPLHSQVSQKEFMNSLIVLINQQDLHQAIKKKILSMI